MAIGGQRKEEIIILGLGEGDILYMDIFSNSIYMGSDENGMPIPACKNLSGTYHLTGCVEVAPEAVLCNLTRPVLAAAGKAINICGLPLPIDTSPDLVACNDELENWAEADIQDILLSGSIVCTQMCSRQRGRNTV